MNIGRDDDHASEFVFDWNYCIITPKGLTICRGKLLSPEGPVLDVNFTPSRGRAVSALAATAVSGRQPAGRALPSLIIGDPTTPSEHVRAERAAMPVASLINVAFPKNVRDLLSPTFQIRPGPSHAVQERCALSVTSIRSWLPTVSGGPPRPRTFSQPAKSIPRCLFYLFEDLATPIRKLLRISRQGCLLQATFPSVQLYFPE